MIKILWLILLAVLLAMPVSAGTNTRLDLVPYGGSIQYKDTVSKGQSTVAGLYGYYGIGMEHLIEADVSWTQIDYDSATLSQIDQYDTTLTYSISTLDWKYRIGAHLITSTDETTESFVWFAGLHNYESSRYIAGVDVYISQYDDYNSGLDVQQLTGTWGFYLKGHPKTYIKAQGHYICLSDDIGFGRKRFSSGELSLVHSIGDWTITLSGWAGEQVFGIQKDGFVVYNLPEKHQGAYGASLRYALSPSTGIKLECMRKRFKELASSNSAQASQLLLVWQQTF